MAAGRKRKQGDRFPCGKRKPSAEELERRMTPRRAEVIEATPETLARRVEVFGRAPKPGEQQGELTCPIDLMSRKLTQEQIWAGRYARSTYARFCIAIGAPRVVAGQLRDYVQGGGGEPLIAIVFDELGNVEVRASGDCTVVWVDERQPHDRVFETTIREDREQLAAFIGDPDTWGRSGDDRQKRLEVQIANINGPALKLVEKES